MRRRVGFVLPAVALALVGLAFAATSGSGDGGHGPRSAAVAVLRDAGGQVVARVKLVERRNGSVAVRARARGISPGFHGFHVHEVGRCEPPFTTAGGHLSQAGQSHGAHAGDMPPLLVTDNGKAQLAFLTDGFSIADLVAGDGSAVMIHVGSDNLANIPSRYHSHGPDASSTFGPDATTMATGDAGARHACGVVRALH